MKRWTKEEICFLRENAGNISIKDISFKLNRSIKAVSAKSQKLKISVNFHKKSLAERRKVKPSERLEFLGIKKKEGREKWTDKDISFLYENAGSMSVVNICLNLHRTLASVEKKARKMNLSLAFYNKSRKK